MSHRCQSNLLHKDGRTGAEMASVSADLPHGYVIPERSHLEDQLLFAARGVMTLWTKPGVWVVPPMRAVWIPADTPHSVSMSGKGLDENALLLDEALPCFFPELCCAECVLAFEGADTACCKFPRLTKKVTTQKRIVEIILDQLKSGDCVPLQLPQPSDSRAIRVARSLLANPADPRTLERMR